MYHNMEYRWKKGDEGDTRICTTIWDIDEKKVVRAVRAYAPQFGISMEKMW